MKRFLLICLSVLPLSIFSQDSLLYIVNPGQNQVEIYNLTQDLFEPPLTYAGFNLGFGNVVFNNDLTKIYITNYLGEFVSVFDAATLAHLGDFGSNPDLQLPEELAFSADGTKLYISNYGAVDSQSVAVYNIDPITGLGVFSNHFGGTPLNPTDNTASLALNQTRDRLYLVSETYNKVSVFDVATETLIGEFTDLNMVNPLGCFYNNTENALYLCNFGNDTISVYAIDPTTGLGTFSRVFGSGASLNGPEDLVFSQDQSLIYVGNVADYITEFDSAGNFIRQINAPSPLAGMTGLGVNFINTGLYFFNASAAQTLNAFFTGSCYYNLISWKFSEPGLVVQYEVYKKIGGNFVLLDTVFPGEPLEYFDRDIKLNQVYEYRIIARLSNNSFETTFFSK